jgi:hypothetical protein
MQNIIRELTGNFVRDGVTSWVESVENSRFPSLTVILDKRHPADDATLLSVIDTATLKPANLRLPAALGVDELRSSEQNAGGNDPGTSKPLA